VTAQLLAVMLCSLAVSWAVTRSSIPFLRRRGLVDEPNNRSSHAVPTPRGGGVGLLAGVAVALVVGAAIDLPQLRWEVLVGCGLIAGYGLIDDFRGGLSVGTRLLTQCIASALVIYPAGGLPYLPLPPPLQAETGILAMPLGMLWLVAVCNIYNFLDGIDGLAGLQGAIAGLSLAFLAPGDSLSVAGVGIAGGCVGFIAHNWHPARVFMGDIGSATLGFLLAALPLQLEKGLRGDAVFFTILCLWFFLSDGVFTILRRLLRGETIWHPHRSHLYQRLVKAGLRHDQVSLRVGIAAGALAIMALASVKFGSPVSLWRVQAAALIAFATYWHCTVSIERSTRPYTMAK